MDERKMLTILALAQGLQLCSAIFFHDLSSVDIKPVIEQNFSDFGFSMAYNPTTTTLYVSAPRANAIGKVYICEMDNAGYLEQISCNAKEIEYTAQYNIDQFPDPHFYMGATLVASSEYFFTCAPLWSLNVSTSSGNIWDVFGTCFSVNESETKQYNGLIEYYMNYKEKRKYAPPELNDFNIIAGGTGWTTLLDEDNDLLLIGKTSWQGDFLYVPASNPTMNAKSFLVKNPNYRYLQNYWNIGYGITAGKFFSGKTIITYYAFSMTEENMGGAISFFKYTYNRYTKSKVLSIVKVGKTEVKLRNNAVAAMFGMTMSSGNLNRDNLDELLVGAPTLSEGECYECGALYIYIGGDMKTINENQRLRTVYGITEFGRFGAAIVVKDLDGDSIPELVVSAPYENHGNGALYILSGYEVYHTLMKYQGYRSLQLSELKLTQRIHKTSYTALGFSLQFVDDTDDNGCSELTASSPDSDTVVMFKCVQTVNVTLSARLVGDQLVREQDPNFTVRVCARIQLADRPLDIIGNVTVSNDIIGEAASIPHPNIVIDISCFNCSRDRQDLCKDVVVDLKNKEPGFYTFKSKAELQNNFLTTSSEFNTSWVVASPYSKLDNSLEVYRHCKGDDCIPQLKMKLSWSGTKTYLLGSSANETATIKVRNEGNASYGACIWFRVGGAPLTQVGRCTELKNHIFKCSLDSPLKRGSEESINITLNMSKTTSYAQQILVMARLYDNCNQNNTAVDKLQIPVNLSLNGISFSGKSHKLNITDKQILENATIYDDHEYVIKNNGNISWAQITFSVTVLRKPYIKSFSMTTMNFVQCHEEVRSSKFITHSCYLDLLPNTTQTITGTTEIIGGYLTEYTSKKKLNMSSTSQIIFDERVKVLFAKVLTEVTIQKEITLSSNKLLISLIAAFVALILLAILIFVLYKCGFFRRKQQQKLLVMKESIRRKSIKRDTHASALDGPAEGLQMEVDDDSPFEEARPVTTEDNVGLVDEKN